MTIRICPQCNKAFYRAAYRTGSDFYLCHHCKYHLLSERAHERKKTSVHFNFTIQRKKRSATIIDYSLEGIRIAYTGQSLPVHAVFDVSVHELKIKSNAKTVWTKKVGRRVETGLKFV